MVLGRFFVALALVTWLALISLPGIVVTYLVWRLSRNMRPALGQTVFRSWLIAPTITHQFVDTEKSFPQSFSPSDCKIGND